MNGEHTHTHTHTHTLTHAYTPSVCVCVCVGQTDGGGPAVVVENGDDVKMRGLANEVLPVGRGPA